MSYCRWSSDWFQCDVYCYESRHGLEIHVSGRRMINKVPDGIIPEGEHSAEQWIQAHAKHMAWMAELEDNDAKEWLDLVTIAPNYASESYTLTGPGECADMLEEIRDSGLNVPQYAIDELREEAAEDAAEDAL